MWLAAQEFLSQGRKEESPDLFSRRTSWDFHGGPGVKTSPFNAGGAGSISGQGAKIPTHLGAKNQNKKTEIIL